MVTCTGHIGIHKGAGGRAYGRTDVDDVMAIKPNFSHIDGLPYFLNYGAPRARLRLTRSSAITNLCRYLLIHCFSRFSRDLHSNEIIQLPEKMFSGLISLQVL